MSIDRILTSVESAIDSDHERAYFLIHEARYRRILEEIRHITGSPIRSGTKVLDVGCFPYHLGRALELMGHKVYGIASAHEPIANKKIAILNIETDRFPYKNSMFDMVLCSEVLEHLPNSPVPAIKEMYRVTKPGGHILVTTPNIIRSINRGKMLLGKSPIPPLEVGGNIYHRHNHEYTLPELTSVVSHAGWHVGRAIHFVSYTPFRRRNKADHPIIRAGKILNYAAMKAIPRLADTLLVIGKK